MKTNSFTPSKEHKSTPRFLSFVILFLSMFFLLASKGDCVPENTATPEIGDPFMLNIPLQGWKVHFFVENVNPDQGYFLFYVEDDVFLIEDEFIPGYWSFRCPFGYHFVYRFDDFEGFLSHYGDPPYDCAVQAFNVGENGIMEYGGGDDPGGNVRDWEIDFTLFDEQAEDFY